MKHIFNWIDTMDFQENTKLHLAFWFVCSIAGLSGAALWYIVQLWYLRSWDWLICFIGYPAVISWIVVLLYSYTHSFHNGKHMPVSSHLA